MSVWKVFGHGLHTLTRVAILIVIYAKQDSLLKCRYLSSSIVLVQSVLLETEYQETTSNDNFRKIIQNI